MKIVRRSSLKLIILLSILISSYIANRLQSNFSLTFNKKAISKHKKESSTTKLQTEVEKLMNQPQEENPEKKSDDLPGMSIYFQGWVKYFRYIKIAGSSRPNKFFKNDEYDVDVKSNKAVLPGNEPKDNYGLINIPDDKHFFAVVYPNKVNILKSRGDNAIANVVDNLSIHNIKSIPDDNNFVGGVRNFGTFSEGSCIEVKTIRPEALFKMSREFVEPPDGMQEVWLICLDTEKQKQDFMNILIKLKLKLQHEFGVYLYAPKKVQSGMNVTPPKVNSIQRTTGNNFPINNPENGPNDGKWIILQDWSQCTLKCGGGMEYQQLMCVPPKKGGNPCEGPAVRTRPCNSHPCPTSENPNVSPFVTPDDHIKKEENVLRPILKMMPISKRPQRYDKCYMKEADVMIRIS